MFDITSVLAAYEVIKAGEKEFDKAKKYGIEVFEDNRTGNLIFISETGSVAVLLRSNWCTSVRSCTTTSWTRPCPVAGCRR